MNTINTDPELTFVAVTTQSRAKRHWALPKNAQWQHYSPLCNTTPWGFDQAEADDRMPARWRKRTVIADLPPCLQCDKSRKRREEGRPQ